MDKGRIIYRDRQGLVGSIIALVITLLTNASILSDYVNTGFSTLDVKAIVGLLFLNGLGFGISFLLLAVLVNRPIFYQKGIAFCKNNRQIDWRPYEAVQRVDCWVDRQGGKIPTYFLIFRIEDEKKAEISHQSLPKLLKHWRLIRKQHPELHDKLDIKKGYKSDEVSKLLFNVVKNS